MLKIIFFINFIIFTNCVPEEVSIISPLSLSTIKELRVAKKLEDIFDKKSEIQLSTKKECIISYITDMEIDSEGNFIVADGWQRRGIFVFAPNGEFIKELGKNGQGPGEYLTPVSVAISSKQEIWVADYMGNRFNIYSGNFNFKKSIVCRSKIPYFIHLNSKDEIYMYLGSIHAISNINPNTIYKYNNQGKEINSFALVPKEVLSLKFISIQNGMTIDKDDFIYEMNPLYYNIRKFNPDGKLIKAFSRKTSLFKLIKDGKRPIIVYGPYYLEKGLIMAQVNKHIEIYDMEGNFITGKLPFTEKILVTKGNKFYVSHWEEGARLENLPNPKIICYKLKTKFFK